ncbi:MAG: EF-hand domain-containing protein [Xanthomonadales bacterium]|nr:EF-hand domain-containing protein [Xanthomonadales bacterium]
MCSRLRVAALIGGALIATAPAWAAGDQTARLAYFEGFDRNGDRRVSVEEYTAYFTAGFDTLDRNADGRLDLDELPAGRGRSPTRERAAHARAVRNTFHRLDRNQDGWLSMEELTAPP